MIKVNIFKNNVKFRDAEFSTQEIADEWIENSKKYQWFGKPEGWYLESDLSEEEKAQEIERREVEIFVNGEVQTVIEIKIPSQYSWTFEDITAEVEAQQKALEAQSLGNQIICKVWAINDAKNLSVLEMQALFADAQLSAIERCLRNGALLTAKALIEALDSSYFSAEEKNLILGMF